MSLLCIPRAIEADQEELRETLRLLLRSCADAAPLVRQALDLLGRHQDLETETVGPLLALLEQASERGAARAALQARGLLYVFEGRKAALLGEHQRLLHLAAVITESGIHQERAEVRYAAQRLRNHVRLYETLLFPAAELAGRSLAKPGAGVPRAA